MKHMKELEDNLFFTLVTNDMSFKIWKKKV